MWMPCVYNYIYMYVYASVCVLLLSSSSEIRAVVEMITSDPNLFRAANGRITD